MHHITEKKLRYWLTLLQAPNISIMQCQVLTAHFGDIETICSASQKQLHAQQLTEKQIHAIHHPNQQWNDDAITWMYAKKNHHIILFEDAHYPPLLKEIASAPILLYVQGNTELLLQPQIAMVGSRNPTQNGIEIAEEFSGLLVRSGFVVTSGLARGIDAASHHGALNHDGKTIAVLGSGLQNIYPSSHHTLAEKIVAQGCLISEFPLKAAPARENFPRRNRIISGLSLGILVVEAALKSGSLITAKFALEQNRDVFAIPGSLRNPTSQGCLSLIQQGAKCVTSINDILNEMNINAMPIPPNNQGHTRNNKPTPLYKLDQTERLVLACIEDDGATLDQICFRSKLAAHLIATTLLRLELRDVVQCRHGSYTKIGNSIK